MNQHILVSVAWPYANNHMHLGHVAGAYLPPDIFARYHRLRGNRVLMVSGSDSHGTPVTFEADKEGVTPRELFLRYHESFLDGLRKLGVSFDLFTHTDTENHHKVSRDIFLRLREHELIFEEPTRQLFCEHDQKFLPDRYVYGKCPVCGFPNARGDQCQNCDSVLDALELGDPQCKLAKPGDPPHKVIVRDSAHFYLDLPAEAAPLLGWFERQSASWRPNVARFAHNYVANGLQARAITRDLEWGIKVPVPGWDDKRLYVWFEAVIGYLSASIEWSHNQGTPDAWKEWWYNPEARAYYFIGKDNIPFHAIIWPAMLMGARSLYDDSGRTLNLPHDIPSNEFLNLEGRKFSKGDRWAVWLPDALARYDPDPLRYYLTAVAPETRDSDFAWSDFLRRNNDELVGTWGNLANRVLTFAYRNFDKQVPQPGELDETDRALIANVEEGFGPVAELLEQVQLRSAQAAVMALARDANAYLNAREPWKEIKVDRARAATTIYVALRVIDSLNRMFSPFLPFSAQSLHVQLGYADDWFGALEIVEFAESHSTHRALVNRASGAGDRWQPSELQPGQALREPQALFKKLDVKIVDEEKARLGAS
ncbi:MAG: methionine--tRNA ligase [Chloroflexi bacterium]|nr:methionine--tRNA ligase [Chloroflexota bacterium]